MSNSTVACSDRVHQVAGRMAQTIRNGDDPGQLMTEFRERLREFDQALGRAIAEGRYDSNPNDLPDSLRTAYELWAVFG